MADYNTLGDPELGTDQIGTSPTVQALYDNPIAIAEGASGAPRVVSGAIDWSSVNGEIGRSQLKTTTGSSSVTRNETQTLSGVLTIPGGEWSFSVETQGENRRRTGGTVESRITTHVGGSGTRTTDNGSFGNIYGPGHIGYWDFDVLQGQPEMRATFYSRYVQSSPPYDHGDGPVQGYVYAQIENDAVTGLYVAEDPPWYGNTRHASIAQWRDPKTGKEYQRTRRLKCCKRDVDEGRISLSEFMARAGEVEDIDEEITPEVKLRGMEEMPQPFVGDVALIDPMDPLTGRLIRMMQSGESVHDLFSDGYLRVSNTPCKRRGPPGVPIHKAKWKST